MEPSAPLTIDDAGLVLAQAVQVMGTLEAACLHEQIANSPLPRGMLTCGEACRLIPAVVVLALQLYPQLLDDGVLETILRNAETTGTTGAVQ